MSEQIAGSHEVINTNGGNPKRNKHAIHIQYGCKRFNCKVCYFGQPFQMYWNNVNKKGK